MNPSPPSMVYMVDAEPALRDKLQRLLESVGLQTLACADADAFLAAYRPDWPGCLLLGASQPERGDPGVQQRLRKQGIDVPVIVIAGHADVAMVVNALRQGALDFIETPFNEQILLDSVHHALTVDVGRRRNWAQQQDFLRRFDTLTAREHDVLRWVVEGLSNREIGETLNLSRKTVEIHRAKVMRKMRADTLSQLIRIAITIGILKACDVYDPDA